MSLLSQVVTLNVIYEDRGPRSTSAPELWSWDRLLERASAPAKGGFAVEVLAAGRVKTHRNEEDTDARP